MKIFTLGKGFASDHLPYPKINERVDFSSKQIGSLLDANKPDVLINCVGKTGIGSVDWCESNKEITGTTNAALPILLADECQKRSIHLIHIGSGCIFYGESPNTQWVMPQHIPNPAAVKVDFGWKETDFANPESFYSKTKYASDLVLSGMKNSTILRIRMPLSDKNLDRNLINKLRKYSKLIDIPNSVTFMSDLVKCVAWCAKESQTGIFHTTNPGTLTAVNIIKEYQKYVPDHKFEVITGAELDKITLAKRSNCILNTDKLKKAGFEMTPAMIALKECMARYVKNI
jgi:dTDP-4-dehydrorhamnose reductase